MSPAYEAPDATATSRSVGLHPSQQVAGLARVGVPGRAVALSSGEALYHQGDSADAAFVVTAGLLSLSVGSRLYDLAGPGDVIGAVSPAMTSYLDSAAALAPDTRLTALASGQQGLAGPTSTEALDRGALDDAATRRIARLAGRLESLQAPVTARVALTFVDLAERFGQEVADGMVRLTLPLTHDTLASLVGAARETTSSAVQDLRKLGLLAGTRGRYLVLPRALREHAATASAD